jgi:hypothetical protein
MRRYEEAIHWVIEGSTSELGEDWKQVFIAFLGFLSKFFFVFVFVFVFFLRVIQVIIVLFVSGVPRQIDSDPA